MDFCHLQLKKPSLKLFSQSGSNEIKWSSYWTTQYFPDKINCSINKHLFRIHSKEDTRLWNDNVILFLKDLYSSREGTGTPIIRFHNQETRDTRRFPNLVLTKWNLNLVLRGNQVSAQWRGQRKHSSVEIMTVALSSLKYTFH